MANNTFEGIKFNIEKRKSDTKYYKEWTEWMEEENTKIRNGEYTETQKKQAEKSVKRVAEMQKTMERIDLMMEQYLTATKAYFDKNGTEKLQPDGISGKVGKRFVKLFAGEVLLAKYDIEKSKLID